MGWMERGGRAGRAGERERYLKLPSNYGDVMGVVVSSSGAGDQMLLRARQGRAGHEGGSSAPK